MDKNGINRQKTIFMLIPGADRPIIRFPLPTLLLKLFPVAVLTVIVACGTWFYYSSANTQRTASMLTKRYNEFSVQLNQEKRNLQTLLAQKDDTIESLRNDMLTLSEQAAEVKRRIDQLKLLESDLKNIAGLAGKAADGGEAIPALDRQLSLGDTGDGKLTGDVTRRANDGRRTVADSGNTVDAESSKVRSSGSAGGMGGSDTPANDQDFRLLAGQTKLSYTALQTEISRLFVSLNETKSVIEQRQALLNGTPDIWPADGRTITSNFGVRRDPFTGKMSLHSGLDIGGSIGDPVYAAAAGEVVETGEDAVHGKHIRIHHLSGVDTIYMHLSKIGVEQGDFVDKGQKIGKIGTTGRSTGPHLHYEVMVRDKPVDPIPYLPNP